MSTHNEAMGAMLRATRVAGGVSLRDVAKWMGLTAVRLGEYERGVKSPASWKRLFQMTASCIYNKGFEYGAAPVGDQ